MRRVSNDGLYFIFCTIIGLLEEYKMMLLTLYFAYFALCFKYELKFWRDYVNNI
jgi:hypothetical protein